jgi:hypothetical protein
MPRGEEARKGESLHSVAPSHDDLRSLPGEHAIASSPDVGDSDDPPRSLRNTICASLCGDCLMAVKVRPLAGRFINQRIRRAGFIQTVCRGLIAIEAVLVL